VSNLIFACWRRKEDALGRAALQRIAERIAQVNPHRQESQIMEGRQHSFCLSSPAGSARISEKSIYVGAFAEAPRGWEDPGSAIPDGTFALVRVDEERVELCSDFAGSRTLWYVLTETHFFASTSQRAIVCLLSGFEVNRSAIGWFVSSGTLGLMDSWDKRLRRLPANGRLMLDRWKWEATLQAPAPEFRPRAMKLDQCEVELTGILRSAVQSFDFQSDRWVLPLSGGLDSRCILAAMHESGLNPRTVTWGLSSSITQPGNDAYIARQLAMHYGLQHDYLLTEGREEPPMEVVDRFLAASGGTTDQLPGYLDGLRLWVSLAARNTAGIIRGDAGFNGEPVRSVQQARTSSTMVMLSDFLDEATAEMIADGRQSIPEGLLPAQGESLACYRDRVYHTFGIPVNLASLNDVKAPFVEIVSPLLSRKVLDFIREMPDAARDDRCVYAKLVKEMGPPIPFATMQADDNSGDYLWSASYVRWLMSELESSFALRHFPASFLRTLGIEIHQGRSALLSSRSFRSTVKRIIPSSWISATRMRLGKLPEVPGTRRVALRVALICRMIRMLEEDASVLGSG